MNLPQNQQFVRLLISMGWQPIHPINVKTGKQSHEVVGCLYPLSNGDSVCYRCCYTFSFSQKDHVKPYCKNDTIDFGDWHVVMTDDLADMAKQLHAYVEDKAKLLTWLEKKYFKLYKPLGVSMVLLVVIRDTVDSCNPTSSVTSFKIIGCIAVTLSQHGYLHIFLVAQDAYLTRVSTPSPPWGRGRG